MCATRFAFSTTATEEAYINWIRQFIVFNGKRHPNEMGASEISRFLSYPAKERNISAPMRNQALSALLFQCHEVLDKPIDWIDDVERARKQQRLPVVLTKEDARAVLNHLRVGFVDHGQSVLWLRDAPDGSGTPENQGCRF